MRQLTLICVLWSLGAMVACGEASDAGSSTDVAVSDIADVSPDTDASPGDLGTAPEDGLPATDAGVVEDMSHHDADLPQDASPVGFAVGEVPADEPDFAPYFDKHVAVFGLNIFGTAGVPDEDMLHAAAVLAQYLDNDEDGAADDPTILSALQGASGGPASMVMFATEWEIESSGIFDSNLGARALQDLYATETHPQGSSPGHGFDATLEEVLHLVTHHGWAKAYPADFAEELGSTLANAMDIARGGQFIQIPDVYPDAAWYHYDDETCSYGCMATEYFYWALTSLLGGQMYPGRCQEIDHEWELCTPEAVQEQDTAITALLQDSGYVLPTVLPDGSYEPAP